jgi:hypothetical protein
MLTTQWQSPAMNPVKSFIHLIDQGFSTQVMLRDGSLIRGFCPYDLIARGNPQAGIVVVRGTVCTDPNSPEDRVIPLGDICGVSSEKPTRACAADAGFLQRNPLPRGWTSLHAMS